LSRSLLLYCIVFSGNPVQDQGGSSNMVTAITSPGTAAICATSAVPIATVTGVSTMAGAVSLGATTFIPNVVFMSTGACTAYAGGTASVIDMQGPGVIGTGITLPVSAPTTSRASSAVGIVTPFLACTKNAAISDSDSTRQTELSSSVHTVQEQVSGSPVVIEESCSIRGAEPRTTTCSVTTSSTSSPISTVATSERGTGRVTEETRHLCPHCNQTFPESIILHHKNLHYEIPFFSCLSCGKNFRTVLGLENHRCTDTAE
jgi:hypothetical protein